MDLVCRRKWEDIAKGEGEKKREKKIFYNYLSYCSLWVFKCSRISFWFSHTFASNYWAGAITLQEEIILGQLEVYRKEPAFLATFMESVKLKVTGVEVSTPQILVSDML